MSITFTSMGSQSMLDTISPTIPPNKRAWSSEVFAKTLVSGYREQWITFITVDINRAQYIIVLVKFMVDFYPETIRTDRFNNLTATDQGISWARTWLGASSFSGRRDGQQLVYYARTWVKAKLAQKILIHVYRAVNCAGGVSRTNCPEVYKLDNHIIIYTHWILKECVWWWTIEIQMQEFRYEVEKLWYL